MITGTFSNLWLRAARTSRDRFCPLFFGLLGVNRSFFLAITLSPTTSIDVEPSLAAELAAELSFASIAVELSFAPVAVEPSLASIAAELSSAPIAVELSFAPVAFELSLVSLVLGTSILS